jgi:Raf kinase inhibitor-like YbhB/YbcL family protein
MILTITSSAFEHNSAMPARYTCEGENISPPLRWTGVPTDARSLALIVDDPDAPDPAAPKRTWVHWLLFNLPPNMTLLPEGCSIVDLPTGSCTGLNDWHRTDYGGPCPPIGRHRYFHKLYALNTTLDGLVSPGKHDLEAAMKGHILTSAEIIGTYCKSQR